MVVDELRDRAIRVGDAVPAASTLHRRCSSAHAARVVGQIGALVAGPVWVPAHVTIGPRSARRRARRRRVGAAAALDAGRPLAVGVVSVLT